MTLAIVGSRSFIDYSLGYLTTDEFVSELKESNIIVDSVVSGGANGADKFGRQFARSRRMGYKEHPEDWHNYGKAAGMIRNKDIINDADCAIVFWDGVSKGTKNIIEHIMSKGIPYQIIRFDKSDTEEWYDN